MPTPAYPVYERGAVFAGKRVLELPLTGVWRLVAGPLRRRLDRRRRAVAQLSEQPDGGARAGQFYEAAAALAREHGFVLASDEAYSELYFAGEPPASALQVSDLSHVAVFNTLSKLAMRCDGISASYQMRHLFGPRYLQHLRAFLGIDPTATGWWQTHDALTFPVLQQLGFSGRPRIAAAAFAPTASAFNGPLVRDTESAFIQALLDAPPLQPQSSATPLATDARSLLQALLRHALQLEYVAAAARLAAPGAGAGPAPRRDVELMNFNAATQVATWRELLASKTAATGQQSIGEFLLSSAGLGSAQAGALREWRAAAAHLGRLDADALQRLLCGTLDACSHRLDAWITSLATQRLEAMRGVRANGLRIGAYGWVLNLRPLPAAAPLATPAGETGPVFALPDDPGFLHAPSLEQAQTAALLRNGHLGKANLQAQGAFAIDLSSRRVRIAEQLLDGVRQGQPLGALLGYRFERSLHERKLDTYVERCRAIAPLVSADAPAPTAASEAIAANRVVDGLLLHQKWQHFVKHQATIVPPPDSPFLVCAAALRELDDGDRRARRRGGGRDRVPGGARQHRAHRQHARGDRARRGAAARVGSGAHAAQRHRPHAPRAVADGRTCGDGSVRGLAGGLDVAARGGRAAIECVGRGAVAAAGPGALRRRAGRR